MATESVTTTSLSSVPSGTKIAIDTVDTDKVVQLIKLLDGTDGSESPIKGANAAPGSTDYGLVVRQVGLPAAAALADGTSNPTLTQIQAFLEYFNGTTWDRARGTTSGLYAQGPAAHNAAAAGNPLLLGGYAATALPSAVAAGNLARLYVDEYGRTHVIAGGIGVNVGTNFTRPADTNAYAAGDAVNNSTSAPTVLTFSSTARLNGGSGTILGAILVDESNPTTPGIFRLLLADTTFTPNNDNAASALSTTIARTSMPPIEFTRRFALGTTAQIYFAPGPFPFKCASGTSSLFGTLMVDNAYTPASSGRFDLILIVQQD